MSSALSIVIPAYNESARIAKTLREVLAYLDEQPGGGEVIVVDDGSKDNTSQVAEQVIRAHARGRIEGRVIRVEPNRGKGNAVRTGLLAARNVLAAFFDADLSMPITETPKLVEPIRSGQYDIVLGSRALDRKLIGTHQPWTREQSGKVFNLVMRALTGLPFADTQCGFKAFRMDVCRPVVEGALIDRFGFDVELLFIAHRAGLRLLEYPVRWNDVAGGSVSFKTGLQGFSEVRQVRTNARRGLYDEAIRRAREAAERVKDRRPLTDDGEGIESDVSPELAGQRI
ncbi:MAG TPA: dolichyl-phosphate beta-glucosyltransferase [Pyrinomonadaceae bacterium]|nr:dolichyl-phosphate beta-glucosyltransferase [Pyrinomonadaceae bacterium]